MAPRRRFPNDPEGFATCYRCSTLKPLTGFHISRRRFNGHKSTCKLCDITIAAERYEKNREHILSISSKWAEENRSKKTSKAAEWARNNPQSLRRYHLQNTYNLTVEQYLEMYSEQQGLCQLCFDPETVIDTRTNKLRPLSIDHDHSCCPSKKSCGKCIRGLLCHRCNMVLGACEDNYDLLIRMADYL